MSVGGLLATLVGQLATSAGHTNEIIIIIIICVRKASKVTVGCGLVQKIFQRRSTANCQTDYLFGQDCNDIMKIIYKYPKGLRPSTKVRITPHTRSVWWLFPEILEFGVGLP